MMDDLFSAARQPVLLAPGALFLPGAAQAMQARLMQQLHEIMAQAPLRRLETPGGRRFSVEMTNCGVLGWHSDRAGYRYESRDPLSGTAWPRIPDNWLELARVMAEQAGHPGFVPQTCLINCYAPGARMGLHQDCDETALESPIVSVSLGVAAQFLFGGLERTTPTRKLSLLSGDVVVWGGPSRLAYHGIAPLKPGHHELTGDRRWNLTFRRVREC
ncbi:DNA oxidative demethylase AlkB [Asaia bogorensis]|uniref:DNA oxidative demethylase AlkB n=1 Tax=Asaia bogorensis TaxID=91915 RepID=UPI003204864F